MTAPRTEHGHAAARAAAPWRWAVRWRRGAAEALGAVRRRVGALLCLAGAALLVHAGSTYARGALARGDARAASERAEAQRAVRDARLLGFDDTPTLVRRGAPNGSPGMPLWASMRSSSKAWVTTSSTPVLVICRAQRPRQARQCRHLRAPDRHFSWLGDLRIGDTVYTETASQHTRWIVTKRRVVGAGRPALFSAISRCSR